MHDFYAVNLRDLGFMHLLHALAGSGEELSIMQGVHRQMRS